MKLHITIALILLKMSCSFAASKEPQYPVSDIPEELLKDANIVYRLDKAEFNIEKVDGSSYKSHVVITILNEKGKNRASVFISYDKLRKINNLDASVYDKNGEQIYKLKKSDIIDESYISGFSLYEDNRIQGVDLRQKDYPYTIEVSYEVNYKSLFFIPDWYVIPGEHVSIQKSEYSITSPMDLKPRYFEINVQPEAFKESVTDGNITYTWTHQNLKAIEVEPMSSGLKSVAPMVYLYPSKFSYDGYEGDMSTWDGLAEWQNRLNKGRDVVPEKTRQEVMALVAGLSSEKEKVKKIYEYMQKRTRYVSIQLGIGGFQPFPAEVVDEMGYGDCKALSNYMRALLKIVGIKSYYTLVYAGSSPPELIDAFPTKNFNHVILAVPIENDTTWLECTSQTNPFGYMGKFTGNRRALMITENGGKLVRTPAYGHETNKVSRNIAVSLDGDGNASTQLVTNFTGIGYEYDNLDYYLTLTDKDRKDWLHENLSIANYELGHYEFEEHKDVIPSIKLTADLLIRKLASSSGKRLFLPLNFMDINQFVPKAIDERKTDVYLKYSSITADTITYQLPQNVHIDYVPEPVNLEYDFGQYQMTTVKKENKLIYYRKLILNAGVYSADKYQEMVDFFKKVRESDAKKAVLMNRT